MKKVLFGLLCTALLWSCESGSRYTITITVPDGVDYVRVTSADEMGFTDLVELKYDAEANTFTGKGRIEEPEMAMVVDADDELLTLVVLEAGDIVVTYDENAPEDYVVTGTPSNDAMTEYRPQLLEIVAEWEQNPTHTAEEQEMFLDRFYEKVMDIVDINNDNLYGVSLFANSAVMVLEPAEILERIDEFPAELRKSKVLEPVRTYAEASLKSSVGSLYTEITAPDVNGNEIALSSVVGEGKWVLLDFWATWCGPCRGELPYLKAAYEKYADRGFVIYGVSLDNNIEAWKAFLPANGMTWPNVIDITPDKQSPAAEAYAIRSIPTNFLISPDGEIIAKNLRGEAVEKALEEIFN